MLNVLIINGGRGAASIIPELIKKEDLFVTSVVNAYDDGKSTGEIRRFFQMLGPSDIRKVQELMLPIQSENYKNNIELFQYRFPSKCNRKEAIFKIKKFVYQKEDTLLGIKFKSEKIKSTIRLFLKHFLENLNSIENLNKIHFNFSDCSIMNCIYAGAYIYCKRDLQQATLIVGQLFKLKGLVLATNNENKQLVALRENGDMLYSEAEIVELRSNVKIERIFLLDKPLDKNNFEKLTINEKRFYLNSHHCNVPISSSVVDAISQSNIIIYSAGTQHSSLYPSYLSTGLAQKISENKNSLKVFITNIGADYETPRYKASDYILGAYRYLCLSDRRNYPIKELFDINLINDSDLKKDESYVKFDEKNFTDIPVEIFKNNFEDPKFSGKHNGKKIVEEILKLYSNKFLLN